METQNTETPEISSANSNTDEKTCCKTKTNINLIISISFVVGLIVLYVLHFTANRSKENSNNNVPSKTSFSIAFLNSDSLMNNYDYVKEIKKKLEEKQKELENQFMSKQTTFENEVTNFQKKVQANAYTTEQAQTIDKQLMEKQQNIAILKENLSNQLISESQEINSILQDSITNFLRNYNKKHNYDYILGYTKGSSSGILFAKNAYDITKDVIKEINNEYKKTKK